jgi:hypothetical protein
VAQFALHAPSEPEVSDALEALEGILRLDAAGEIDLPPYLTRLLLQLEETLEAVRLPGHTVGPAGGRS